MPRELSEKPCEVTFSDRISGDNMTIFYRLPTTEERIKYSNSLITRKLNKIKSNIGENRIASGLKIIKGFKEGAFSLPDTGIISSDPAASNYDPQWKEHIKQYAADVLEMLAVHVFDAPLGTGEAESDDDEEEVEDPS